MEIISNMLGLIADVIGVVTFLFTIGFFWYKARKYSKALKLLKKQETPGPIALAISSGRNRYKRDSRKISSG